jgi:diguanylate cyclase (GGDEF)-like protein
MGDAGLAFAAGVAAFACLGRAAALARHHRAPCNRCYSWLLAGLSCLAAAVGNGLWAWYELARHASPPDPSAADWSFIFFGPLALAALLVAHGERIGVAARIRLLLDTVLVAGSLFALAWAVALAMTAAKTDSPVRTFLVLGYPAFDLILVSLLLALRSRTPDQPGGIGVGVRMGYLVIVFCDSVFTMPGVRDAYQAGGLLDTGWFAGYLLIAAAATTGDGVSVRGSDLRAGTDAGGRDDGRIGPLGPVDRLGRLADTRLAARVRIVRVILPYVAAAFCLAGVLADGLDGDKRMDPVLLVACSAVLAALVARQGMTLLENQRLAEDLRRAAERLQHHAYHDPLTGLANRALLTDRLEHALTQRQAEWEPVAVLFLDLDGFKAVNDSAGHESGDRVLVEAARRISGTLRVGDTVARIGGDEFVVVLETGTPPEGALLTAERVLAVLSRDYVIDGQSHRTGASIGLAFSAPGGSASDLLRRADAAMYQAKSSGKGRVHCEPLSPGWAGTVDGVEGGVIGGVAAGADTDVPNGETAPVNA